MKTIAPGDLLLDLAPLLVLLRHLYGELHDVRFDAQQLQGGLVSNVGLVSARFMDAHGRPRTHRIVVKALEGREQREADIYERVLRGTGLAPRSLGTHRDREDRLLLFLEAIPSSPQWPWRDVEATRRVLQQAATLHTMALPSALAEQLHGCDCEAELVAQGHDAIELLKRGRKSPLLGPLRSSIRPLRRVVEAMSELRRQLLGFERLRSTLLHGDLHSGNVIVTAADAPSGARSIVLIDWARARLGSPLEDVSSWLQSLGFWEWVAKQRHDTLLSAYLEARGESPQLTRDLRSAYWLAGACNALGGALTYHLRVAAEDRGSAAPMAAAAARDWLRIVRRADACWGGAS